MNPAPRFDLFAPIHKALRQFMADTLLALGRLDLDDAAERAATLAQLDALLEAAGRHLAHEDAFIHPAVEAAGAGGSRRIAAEHRDHRDAIATLHAQAELLRAEPEALAAHRLYRQLAAFIAENFEHMDIEETLHNRALWAAYGDAELQAIEQRLRSSLGAEERAMWLHWLIPALNPAQRAQWIGGLPEAERAPALDAARARLDGAAWAKLCRALGRPPVPGQGD